MSPGRKKLVWLAVVAVVGLGAHQTISYVQMKPITEQLRANAKGQQQAVALARVQAGGRLFPVASLVAVVARDGAAVEVLDSSTHRDGASEVVISAWSEIQHDPWSVQTPRAMTCLRIVATPGTEGYRLLGTVLVDSVDCRPGVTLAAGGALGRPPTGPLPEVSVSLPELVVRAPAQPCYSGSNKCI